MKITKSSLIVVFPIILLVALVYIFLRDNKGDLLLDIKVASDGFQHTQFRWQQTFEYVNSELHSYDTEVRSYDSDNLDIIIKDFTSYEQPKVTVASRTLIFYKDNFVGLSYVILLETDEELQTFLDHINDTVVKNIGLAYVGDSNQLKRVPPLTQSLYLQWSGIDKSNLSLRIENASIIPENNYKYSVGLTVSAYTLTSLQH